MKYEILYKPVYSLLKIDMMPGESIRAESGAMVSIDSSIDIESAPTGGILSSLKRSVLGGESFFQNTFTCKGSPGSITLAPSYAGDIQHIPMSGQWLAQSGAFLASSAGIEADTSFQGLKGAISGEGLFFLLLKGQGDLFISSFGAIHEMDIPAGQEIRVDTGNLVAFQAGVSYSVEKIGGIKSTLLSGEGLVLRLKGPGKVYIQTRSVPAFVGWLYPKLPKPSSH